MLPSCLHDDGVKLMAVALAAITFNEEEPYSGRTWTMP